jgi:hypothetical protein
MESENWLKYLTKSELERWESKSQSDKDWWYANTKPEDRGSILRTEISGAASYNEFLHLTEVTRNAITKRLDERADAARIRIRERLAKESREKE